MSYTWKDHGHKCIMSAIYSPSKNSTWECHKLRSHFSVQQFAHLTKKLAAIKSTLQTAWTLLGRQVSPPFRLFFSWIFDPQKTRKTHRKNLHGGIWDASRFTCISSKPCTWGSSRHLRKLQRLAPWQVRPQVGPDFSTFAKSWGGNFHPFSQLHHRNIQMDRFPIDFSVLLGLQTEDGGLASPPPTYQSWWPRIEYPNGDDEDEISTKWSELGQHPENHGQGLGES